MSTLPPQLRIANTAAVLDGPYGNGTQHAKRSGVSRQALYRDAPKVLQAVEDSDVQRGFQDLQNEIDRLHAERTTLRRLSPAARRSAPLLEVLDEFGRKRVEQGAGEEIFFGRQPCLMVVEQHSLCWVTGRLVEQRDGVTWAQAFQQLPNLQQLTRDGGSGLRKGLAVVNAQRQQQGRVSRLIEKAEDAEHRERQKVRRCGSRQGVATAVAHAWREAEQAMDAWSGAERAWTEVSEGVRLVTPARSSA